MNAKKIIIGLIILAIGFYLGRNMPMLTGTPVQPPLAG
jgi:hypothetical protein